MAKSFRKQFLGAVKKAVTDFGMIEEGDRVAVGMSGGKDSTSLLHALYLVGRSAPVKFMLEAVFVDLGWPMDVPLLEEFCAARGISLHVVKTDIGEIVFKRRKGQNPCALCAHLRRGAFHGKALELGCGKVALGHQLDDALETFFMSLFYTGQLRTFSPSTFLDRSGLTMIRPLIYLTSEDVRTWAKRENLPVLSNPCPASGITKRDEARKLVAELTERYPELKARFLTALQTFDRRNLWPER
ncbi:MAG: putative ATPase [Pelotomaculum thermopropionicum]|uniref:Putative ATPase n=1 Tax=Pelotomaculum thermopropionicum TaxID=110500 RepID=A0A101HUH8_9FIRM|nr:MAG: putative ATPase [Pelotomaculum thermopropionicum]